MKDMNLTATMAWVQSAINLNIRVENEIIDMEKQINEAISQATLKGKFNISTFLVTDLDCAEFETYCKEHLENVYKNLGYTVECLNLSYPYIKLSWKNPKEGDLK